VDGTLRKVTPTFHITNRMLSGKLVAARPRWRTIAVRQLRGLAIYSRVLSPAQVLQHYTSWTSKGRPDIIDPEGPLALYLFGEGTGSRLRSEVSGAVTSTCRALPRPGQTYPISTRSRTLGGYHCNIVGFVPLALPCADTSSLLDEHGWRSSSPSSSVEFSACSSRASGFSSNRDSDMTDLITNLLGGAIGALLYRRGAQDPCSTSPLTGPTAPTLPSSSLAVGDHPKTPFPMSAGRMSRRRCDTSCSVGRDLSG